MLLLLLSGSRTKTRGTLNVKFGQASSVHWPANARSGSRSLAAVGGFPQNHSSFSEAVQTEETAWCREGKAAPERGNPQEGWRCVRACERARVKHKYSQTEGRVANTPSSSSGERVRVVVRTVAMAASYAAKAHSGAARSAPEWLQRREPGRTQANVRVGGRQRQAGRHTPATVHCRGSMAHDDDEQDRQRGRQTNDGDIEDGDPEKDGA
ncbi:hypothetical protein TgHK011_000671 [Trichoderma gracile]|nr:hypothetical protein TgHK011_000671 [Trichoderma gracile]